MKEIDQQIALCEWAGIKVIRHKPRAGATPSNGVHIHQLPDTNSLDVLHEMEKRLTKEQRLPYHMNLVNLMDDEESPEDELWPAWHATAAQRRQALLMTLNLWREDSNEGRK